MKPGLRTAPTKLGLCGLPLSAKKPDTQKSDPLLSDAAACDVKHGLQRAYEHEPEHGLQRRRDAHLSGMVYFALLPICTNYGDALSQLSGVITLYGSTST